MNHHAGEREIIFTLGLQAEVSEDAAGDVQVSAVAFAGVGDVEGGVLGEVLGEVLSEDLGVTWEQ